MNGGILGTVTVHPTFVLTVTLASGVRVDEPALTSMYALDIPTTI